MKCNDCMINERRTILPAEFLIGSWCQISIASSRGHCHLFYILYKLYPFIKTSCNTLCDLNLKYNLTLLASYTILYLWKPPHVNSYTQWVVLYISIQVLQQYQFVDWSSSVWVSLISRLSLLLLFRIFPVKVDSFHFPINI